MAIQVTARQRDGRGILFVQSKQPSESSWAMMRRPSAALVAFIGLLPHGASPHHNLFPVPLSVHLSNLEKESL